MAAKKATPWRYFEVPGVYAAGIILPARRGVNKPARRELLKSGGPGPTDRVAGPSWMISSPHG